MKQKYRIPLLLSFFLLLSPVVSLQAQDDDEGTDPLTEAATAMRRRDYLKAEGIYRGWLRTHPEDVHVKQLLSHALINQKKFSEADSMLRRMVEADTSEAGNYWYCGLSAERQLKDSLAVVHFKKYIRKMANPDNLNVSAWLHIGSAYRRMMHGTGIGQYQFDDMLLCYENYLALNPTDPYSEDLRLFMDDVRSRRPGPGEKLVWDEKN